MEQMYLIEIFIDKIAIYVPEDEKDTGNNKRLITKVRFGENVQFIFKEEQLAKNNPVPDEIVQCDEKGRKKWVRTVKVGKSYLFPSYPDTVIGIFNKYPLEIELWNDDDTEEENIFIGVGYMQWETQFIMKLKESAEPCKMHAPLSIKQRTVLSHECCCAPAAEVEFILRLSPLGSIIITEFQQPLNDPDLFIFRTDKAPSLFSCKRVEVDDPKYSMKDNLYENAILQDPQILSGKQKQMDVCTELQSCGMGTQGVEYRCDHAKSEVIKNKEYPIDRVKMGDITGPCGNTSCPLAHQIRTYIRNMECYKLNAQGITDTKYKTRKICGTCDCKDDHFHREECVTRKPGDNAVCTGCGGAIEPGHSCKEVEDNIKNAGRPPSPSQSKATSKSSKESSNVKKVAYVFSVHKVPDFKESMFGRDYTCQSLNVTYNDYLTAGASRVKSDGRCCCRSVKENNEDIEQNLELNSYLKSGISCVKTGGECCCRHMASRKDAHSEELFSSASSPNLGSPESRASTRSIYTNNQLVYNVHEVKPNKYCLEITDDKDCKCSPKKPPPPCRTFDCDCLTETVNIASRKRHKPFCPLYKHKAACPVNKIDDDDNKKLEEDEDAVEPLPYGLPPIKLGPCPVMCRPCSVPDGFTKLYKNAAQPPPPPSQGEIGKVCCSKEYERIKTALKEYMKNNKDHDLRCVNTFNIDTQKRCCDKEQILLALMGKTCCGTHKLALQDKFKEDDKKK